LHDGGVNVNVYKNNQIICDSEATYSGGNMTTAAGGAAAPMAGMEGMEGSGPAAAPVVPAAPIAAAAPATASTTGCKQRKARAVAKRHEDPMDGMPHISQMKSCSMLGAIKAGDTLHIDANYDLDKYMPMTTKSDKPSPVMGIAIMFVAVDE